MKTKGILFIGIMILSANTSFAKIVSNSSSSLDNDLSYIVDDEESSKRNIASDEQVQEEDALEDEGDRDVASDGDDNSNSIQYWKY